MRSFGPNGLKNTPCLQGLRSLFEEARVINGGLSEFCWLCLTRCLEALGSRLSQPTTACREFVRSVARLSPRISAVRFCCPCAMLQRLRNQEAVEVFVG